MGTSAFYLHRQPWRVHTIVFHANQQVQLLSEVSDFATVDTGQGGNTNWVRDCSDFYIQFRSRMDGTKDLRQVNCKLVGKSHVRTLPLDIYAGTIQSYTRHDAPHVLIFIPRFDCMSAESLSTLNLRAADGKLVEETDEADAEE